MSLSGFDIMYQQIRHNCYMYNDGKEILYNTLIIALPRAICKIKHSALGLDANIALGFA